jgi:hypothetical protein
VLSLLLLPNLALRSHHGWREVLMIDLPLFFGTTLSIASFYLASEREIAKMSNPGAPARFQWSVLRRLPLVMSIGIGLCINQTRAVLEALAGRETEFVRTPKHGIRGKLESWSSKKYRAAKSITPFIELGMAAYFVVAILVALDHGHYMSIPFLGLFLAGFGYVGWVSLWQGGVGLAIRNGFVGAFARLLPRHTTTVVPPPPLVVMKGATETVSSSELVFEDGAMNAASARTSAPS